MKRNSADGPNTDNIEDALRQPCGSFGTADDVIVFKAIEQVSREKADGNLDNRNRLLGGGLRLFWRL